uniref:Polycystin cation channel PKD1/PKD2 domain-containing protein n=1 Tax=Guillardia theta TaxID=55529 RepID=A0A7S4PNM3_GUITH|mmetsp:Transcript_7228/g.24941  ORF Transcript_7228/g.24941 Transcript_7228/m.24941 type:complete len:541 (+) Transcript_7228:639-2261(+)
MFVLSSSDDITKFLRNFGSQTACPSCMAFWTNYTMPGTDGMILGNALTGRIEIIQNRISEGKCSKIHANLVKQGLIADGACYPPWNPEAEAQTFTIANDVAPTQAGSLPFFKYRSSALAGFTGVSGTYPASGFVASFTSADAAATIESLIANQWVDAKTRFVLVAFAVYNLEMQFFVLSDVAFELLSNGATIIHQSSDTIVPSRYDMGSFSGLIRIAMLALVFLMVIYYAFEELDSCRRNGLKKYRTPGWGYVELTNILLFVLFGFLKLANYISYQIMIYQKSDYNSLLSRLRSLAKSYFIEDQVAGLIAFLLWFKLLKYICIHKNLLLYTKALEHGFFEFVSLGAIFCPLWFGYGIMGYMLFGETSEQFSSITRSCQSLILGMYGHLDFIKLQEEIGDAGIAFTMIWIFMSTSTFFNVTVAFMIEALNVVSSDEATLRTQTVLDKVRELIERRNAELKEFRKSASKQHRKKARKSAGKRSCFPCCSSAQVADEEDEEVQEVEVEGEAERNEELEEIEREPKRRQSSIVEENWNPWTPPE